VIFVVGQPNAPCSASTASVTWLALITQLMRIGEVEMRSRFTPASASVENILAATPGCVFMPAPTSETFAMESSIT